MCSLIKELTRSNRSLLRLQDRKPSSDVIGGWYHYWRWRSNPTKHTFYKNLACQEFRYLNIVHSVRSHNYKNNINYEFKKGSRDWSLQQKVKKQELQIQILVKSRFNPYFGWKYNLTRQAKVGIKSCRFY